MENASKALIIAGAILISIVLIAIGVMIVNSANNVVNQASDTMSDQDIQIFNAKFENYAGKRKGNQVKSLINAIRSNNATSKGSGGQAVGVDGAATGLAVTGDPSNGAEQTFSTTGIKDNAYYDITFEYDTNGCIKKATINDASTKSPVPGT